MILARRYPKLKLGENEKLKLGGNEKDLLIQTRSELLPWLRRLNFLSM